MVIPLAAAMLAPSFSAAHAAPLWTLQGHVVNKDGKPMPNAAVALSIMPSGVLTTPTPDVTIANVVSAPDGSFAIPAPSLSATAIDQAVHNDGWLNLDLTATPSFCTTVAGCFPGPYPNQSVVDTNGYVAYVGDTALSVLVAPSQVTAAPLGTIQSAPNDILLTVYGVQGQAQAQPIPPATPCVSTSCLGAPQTAAPPMHCSATWQTIAQEKDWEPVGEIHTWDDMTGSMGYGTTASTDLGVAFDYSGNGNWSYGGAIHMGNSASATADALTVGPDTAQQMNGEFGWAKDQGSYGNCSANTTYRIRALSWTGGFQLGAYVPGNDGPSKYNSVSPAYQADMTPGKGWSKNSGKSYKYTWQVSAFGVFTLSSESDYSSQVVLHWDMGTNGVQHSLFGYGAAPAAQNVELIFASTEPLPPPTYVSPYGPAHLA